MKNRWLMRMCGVTGVALLVLLGFIIGSNWNSPGTGATGPTKSDPDPAPPTVKEGEKVEAKNVKGLPPSPKAVKDENRVKQDLKPGYTYRVNSAGVTNIFGTDADYGFTALTKIGYSFETEVDRFIESNDGKRISELRTYRKVRTYKLNQPKGELYDFRLSLAPDCKILLGGAALLQGGPDVASTVVGSVKILEGSSFMLACFEPLSVSACGRPNFGPRSFSNSTLAISSAFPSSSRSVNHLSNSSVVATCHIK